MGAGMSLLGGKKGAVLGWGPRCPRSGTCCPLPVQLGARQELGSAGAGTGLGMEDGGAAAGRARCPAWAAGGQAGGCPRWQGPVSPTLGDTGQTGSRPFAPKKAAGRCLGASHLPCLSFPLLRARGGGCMAAGEGPGVGTGSAHPGHLLLWGGGKWGVHVWMMCARGCRWRGKSWGGRKLRVTGLSGGARSTSVRGHLWVPMEMLGCRHGQR